MPLPHPPPYICPELGLNQHLLVLCREARPEGAQTGGRTAEQDCQLPQGSRDFQQRRPEPAKLLVQTPGQAPGTSHALHARPAAYFLPEIGRFGAATSNN